MLFPILYEINTRCWLNELSTRVGRGVTLDTVPDSEFTRWEQAGFTHLWLMGVWTSGPRSRAVALVTLDIGRVSGGTLPQHSPEEITGSPYAVAEYRVPQALGGDAALQAFRRRLHAHGIKLILDFVPNHVGLDHRWLSERSELFVQSRTEMPGTFAQQTEGGVRWIAHGRDPNFPPWVDTAQLDYRTPATRAAMLESLRAVADKCDGLRCDMAMLILNEIFAKTWAGFPRLGVLPPGGPRVEPPDPGCPGGFAEARGGTPNTCTEFWQEAIASTKQAYPDFLFLAEVYWGLEERLQSLGFDYTYDKEFYDELIRRNAAGVQQHLLAATPESIAAGAHFLENHDEARIASILSPAEHRAAALLMLSLPGMRLLQEGQLEGARVKTPVQLLRRQSEPRRSDIEQMYQQILLALRKTAVGRGKGMVLKPRKAWAGNPTAQNIVILQWQAEPPEFDLAIVNLAPHRSQCYGPLGVANLAGTDWVLSDLLGTEIHRYSGQELQNRGLYLDLPENGAQLFHFQPAP